MTDEPDLQIVLRVLPDPHARHGRPARDGSYRTKLLLKHALRALGLKCVAVRDVRTDLTAPTEQEMAHAKS